MKKLLLIFCILSTSCIVVPRKGTVVGIRTNKTWKCIVESVESPNCYVESYAESFERAVSNGKRGCVKFCGTQCEFKYCL